MIVFVLYGHVFLIKIEVNKIISKINEVDKVVEVRVFCS